MSRTFNASHTANIEPTDLILNQNDYCLNKDAMPARMIASTECNDVLQTPTYLFNAQIQAPPPVGGGGAAYHHQVL